MHAPGAVIHNQLIVGVRILQHQARIIIVDFHAEATSEKMAMGWHLDGKVTAVLGTHTHVQTADERLLPNGTAYLTDAGMTGPHDSIIGMQVDPSLGRFLNATTSLGQRKYQLKLQFDERFFIAEHILIGHQPRSTSDLPPLGGELTLLGVRAGKSRDFHAAADLEIIPPGSLLIFYGSKC